jgi:response regulator NasT
MTPSLRVVVADDEPDMREYFQRVLRRLGHDVVGVASDGLELLRICEEVQPDLVVSDIKMPGKDGIDAAVELYRRRPVAVILVSAHHEAALIERAAADHVLSYLITPLKQADLEPAIALAWQRFQEFEALRRG